MLLFKRRRKASSTPAAAGSASAAGEEKPASFPAHADGDEVHYRVACDACGMRPVTGPCYRCMACKNYDLCEACYAWVEDAHPGHTFERRPPPPSGLEAALAKGVAGGVVKQALLEMHYVRHRGFLQEPPGGAGPLELLKAAGSFPFSGVLVHGAGDAVCPVENAEALAEAWPGAELRVTGGGHLQWDPPNVDAFVRALDDFASGYAA